jgi:phenylpropionate dioxygenase-like ring-hydroxylating dioxygenase large terminal subunit
VATLEESTRHRLRSGEYLEEIVRPQEGLISRRIFSDPEVFELEVERIFGRAWFFVGHESEIKEPGDFVSRPCGLDPAVLLRDDDGVVRVFLNSCRHRGMRICRTDRGNTSFLRCPYHGWSYRNSGELLNASCESHYGPGELVKEDLGLIPASQLGIYQGLVFATWDASAPPLDEYLGNVRWYLDIVFGRTGGLDVVGVPQVWEVDTAWKFATDNFTDNFHVFNAHHSLVELGMLPNDPDFACYGHMITPGNGHVLHFVKGAPGDDAFMGLGLPHELRAKFDDHLEPAQAGIAREHGISAGTVWPNFHWLQLPTSGDMESEPVPFLNFRIHQPLSPTRTRMWSWIAVDRDASEEHRRESYETYVRTFGPSGIFDQDDMENWEDCTRASIGPAARRYTLNHRMGLNRATDPDWPGPGPAYPDSYGEMTQRAWYAQWLEWMTR